MSLGIAENFSNVAFEANTSYCPPGEYGHDVDQSDDEVNVSYTHDEWRDFLSLLWGNRAGSSREVEDVST